MPENGVKRSIEFKLGASSIDRLRLMAEAGATTMDVALEGLIARAYEASLDVLRDDAKWAITLNAKRSFLSIVGRRESPENLDFADNALHAMAIDAIKAEHEGRRKPSRLDSGALRYRGPSPQRLTLVVKNGALVDVTASQGRLR